MTPKTDSKSLYPPSPPDIDWKKRAIGLGEALFSSETRVAKLEEALWKTKEALERHAIFDSCPAPALSAKAYALVDDALSPEQKPQAAEPRLESETTSRSERTEVPTATQSGQGGVLVGVSGADRAAKGARNPPVSSDDERPDWPDAAVFACGGCMVVGMLGCDEDGLCASCGATLVPVRADGTVCYSRPVTPSICWHRIEGGREWCGSHSTFLEGGLRCPRREGGR